MLNLKASIGVEVVRLGADLCDVFSQNTTAGRAREFPKSREASRVGSAWVGSDGIGSEGF